jgi:hypothetical protein
MITVFLPRWLFISLFLNWLFFYEYFRTLVIIISHLINIIFVFLNCKHTVYNAHRILLGIPFNWIFNVYHQFIIIPYFVLLILDMRVYLVQPFNHLININFITIFLLLLGILTDFWALWLWSEFPWNRRMRYWVLCNSIVINCIPMVIWSASR